MQRVRLFRPGERAPVRRGHPGTLGNLPYGENRSTHPPGHYDESHVFNEGSKAIPVTTPWRKMAQYAFTGSATAVLALPANHLRCYLIVQNVSAATNLYIGFGAAIDASTGLLILPGGGNFLADYSPPTDDIYIFFAAGAAERVIICEGVYQIPDV